MTLTPDSYMGHRVCSCEEHSIHNHILWDWILVLMELIISGDWGELLRRVWGFWKDWTQMGLALSQKNRSSLNHPHYFLYYNILFHYCPSSKLCKMLVYPPYDGQSPNCTRWVRDSALKVPVRGELLAITIRTAVPLYVAYITSTSNLLQSIIISSPTSPICISCPQVHSVW